MPSDFEAQLVTTQSVEHGTCCCTICPKLDGDCALCPPLQVQIPDFSIVCLDPKVGPGACNVFTAPITPMDTVFHPTLNCRSSGCIFPPVPPSTQFNFCQWCELPGIPSSFFYYVQLACGAGQVLGGVGIPNIPRWIISILFGHTTGETFNCGVITLMVWISDGRTTGFPGTDGAHCPPLGDYNYWYSVRLSSSGCGEGDCLAKVVEPVEPALVMLQ